MSDASKVLEDKKMQKIRYNFLFVIGLVLIFGTAANVFSQSNKVPKNMGVLSVKTSPASYPVRINGEVVGMSGVGEGRDFVLRPGTYKVEVEGANGQTWTKEDVVITKSARNCICLKIIDNITKRACPYNIVVDGPDRVLENDIITFSSRNLVTEGAIPVNYKWTVSGGTITSGLGTSSITVDTRGMGGKVVKAYLDVTDDVYGSTCMQKNEVETGVDIQELPKPYQCDIFEAKNRDDIKARYDNCVIRVQETPNSQLYVILYQGTEKGSPKVDVLSKMTLDYFVKSRGVDPRNIVITKWGSRPRTTVEVWVVPPGAQPPVPGQ